MAARLRAAFAASKPTFVGYLTAGFPSRDTTVPALLAMQAAGVRVIEVRLRRLRAAAARRVCPYPFPPSPPRALQVGVPFSDPLADGGTIQKANEVALANGVTLHDVLDMVRAARAGGLTVPVVLMGYYNPFLRYGEAALTTDAAAAGVDGFIVVDLPCEDAGDFLAQCDRTGLAFVPLVASTTETARLPKIAEVARGFVYCVSVTGVTGARSELPPDLPDFLARIRAHIPLPLAVGFGLSTREQAVAVGGLADGVVMGSAIVRAVESGGVEGLTAFLRAVIPPPATGGR
jgi:tryptophan synthase alpha subunit